MLIYNPRIQLSDKQAEALGVTDSATIQAIVQDLVTRLAAGGFMLPVADRQRIEKITGPIKDGGTIVKSVEEGHDREGDNIVVRIVLDPIWLGELQNIAAADGRDLNALLSDLFSMQLHMGSFYDMNQTERVTVYLTPEQHVLIKRKLSVDRKLTLTGNRLSMHFGWRPETSAEDDPFALEKAEAVL